MVTRAHDVVVRGTVPVLEFDDEVLVIGNELEYLYEASADAPAVISVFAQYTKNIVSLLYELS